MVTNTFHEAIEYIRDGKIGVIPTDTLYGLVGSAMLRDVVERIYAVRGRDLDKPCIILLSSMEDLNKFNISVTEDIKIELSKYWPGAVSVVLPCNSEELSYLHRGKNSLAFRIPDPKHTNLVEFLKKAGPVIAPSANLQGTDPATTVEEAKEYFDTHVDFYVDSGECKGEPSTVISIDNGVVKVLREGMVKVNV